MAKRMEAQMAIKVRGKNGKKQDSAEGQRVALRHTSDPSFSRMFVVGCISLTKLANMLKTFCLELLLS